MNSDETSHGAANGEPNTDIQKNATTYGTVGPTTGSNHKFNPDFTQHVIDTMGPNVTPRNRQIFTAFFRHLHDFTREVELTTEEWLASVKFLNSIGQISDVRRNEGHRMCDIVGLESLVDEINYYHNADELEVTPTSSAILGPFWSANAPFRKIGDSIIMSPHKGQVTRMHGVVMDASTRKPIPGAVVDIWQASSNGKYDFQDPENQVDNNLRGKFKCNENGEYWFYCLKPTAYSLPTDGPAGQLLKILDRHAMRPAHIHLMVTSPSHRPLINQIYPRNDPYLATDTVFAVKDDLVVDFKPSKDPKAELDLEFNITLIPKSATESSEPHQAGPTQAK